MKLFRITTVPMSLNILLKGQLRFLDTHFEVTAISGAGPDLELVEEREGVKTHAIEMERPISPLKDVISLIQLYRYFKKEKPDIIHSITPKAGLLSMVAGKWAGVPVRMHTFTGLIFPHKEGHFQTVLIWMDRLLCRFATHVYPEGEGVRQDLLNHRISDKPLKVLAHGNVNGIDLSYFNPHAVNESTQTTLRSELGISQKDLVFLFVGRLVKDKGINELVAAFCALKETSAPVTQKDDQKPERTPAAGPDKKNFKLVLVGPPESTDPLLPETARLILNHPDIHAVGFQEDVRPYYSISDVLVFPSYREGFPNVVLQTGAMELPAIVTDISGCNEIVEDGKNGLIIPVRNQEALQTAMKRLAEDQPLRNVLKSHSRTFIEGKYGQQKVWDAVLEEYERVLNEVKHPR